VGAAGFEILCEVEPATEPDLAHVRDQIETMSELATAFLIPDNHIGRATVSSIAVAHEVAEMGGRAIACLNARDRNLLGFRRDLLTAAAYGVDEFLFVYGDRPESGRRSDDLNVRTMIAEARQFSTRHHQDGHPFRLGVTSGLGLLPGWKLEADFLLAQVAFSLEALIEWREAISFSGPVFAGVMVVASAAMARKLSRDVPQLAVPDEIVARLDQDPSAGVTIAADLVTQIYEAGAFDGVHLIPVSRYREISARFQGLGPA
jgi:5,10-methylenetetrahydrofolate reductase